MRQTISWKAKLARHGFVVGCLAFGLIHSSFSSYAQERQPATRFDALVKAVQANFQVKDRSYEADFRRMLPAERLRLQRKVLANHQVALKWLRLGLGLSDSKRPVLEIRAVETFNEAFSQMRQVLHIEAQVREADNNWPGALDSELTILELQAVLDSLDGVTELQPELPLEANPFKNIQHLSPRLDGLTLRSAVERMKAFETGQSLPRRFTFDIVQTYQRLLLAAFQLRLARNENGGYPEQFIAPLDPFNPGQSLKYFRDGESYELYSLGPDGRDDGGQEIQTIETDEETGLKRVTTNLRSSSIGDILGPVF